MLRLLIFSFLLWIIPNLSLANEEELYDAVPPANSSFVRFVNSIAGDAKLTAKIKTTYFNDLSYGDVSAYAVIKQGKRNVVFGDSKQEFDIAAGNYYTIIKNDAKDLLLIKDDIIENPAKAMIYFYNISDKKMASLISLTHKSDIFKDVENGESKSREINALTIGLTIKSEDVDIQSFDDVVLKRRMGTSFFLMGKGGNYKAVMVKGSINKE